MSVESATTVGSSQIKTHSSLRFSNKEIRDDLQEPLPRIGPEETRLQQGLRGSVTTKNVGLKGS